MATTPEFRVHAAVCRCLGAERRTARRRPIKHARGTPGLLLVLAVAVCCFARIGTVVAAGTIVDAQGVPGPSDVAVVRKAIHTYLVTLSFGANEVRTSRVLPDGALTPVDAKPTGSGPRAVAIAKSGAYAVTANSESDDLSVHAIGDNGVLTQVGPNVASGGDNPFDVGIVFDDMVVVANRDSDAVALFRLDRHGVLSLLSTRPAGLDPHIIAVSPRGLVAVGNSSSNDLSLFEIPRDGSNIFLRDSIPVGNSPKAMTFDKKGQSLFVATRGTTPGVEDQILGYSVSQSGSGQVALRQESTTPGGYFVTDIKTGQTQMHVATVDAAQTNQVWSFDAESARLHFKGAVQLSGAPSYKQMAVTRGPTKDKEIVLVGEFQANLQQSVRVDR